MTRTLPRFALATVLGSLAGLCPAGAGDWSSWEPALARHVLRDLDGASVRLHELRGDVVVVNFWASWCKPCKKELVHLDEWNATLADRPARILAVSIDRDRRNAVRFAESAGLTLPIYHDGAEGLAEKLDLPFLPCTVVLDPWGRVVRVTGGGSEESLLELRGAVESLLPEEKTSAASSRSGVSG